MSLEARNLNFSYGTTPLIRDFSLSLERGEFVMLSGPNGSGKSTILKLLSAFYRSDNGEVLLDGENINKIPLAERAKKIAVVPQQNNVVLDFTVSELVMLGRSLYLSRFLPIDRESSEICQAVMDRLEISQFADRVVNKLSVGEQARVFLAKALVQKSDFLLLDEPTAALDIENAKKIMEILRKLSDKIGILMICHDLNMAWKYADKLYLLKNGETVACGEPKSILNSEVIGQVYNSKAEIIADKGIIFN